VREKQNLASCIPNSFQGDNLADEVFWYTNLRMVDEKSFQFFDMEFKLSSHEPMDNMQLITGFMFGNPQVKEADSYLEWMTKRPTNISVFSFVNWLIQSLRHSSLRKQFNGIMLRVK